jgi:hypothetical protein
MNKVFTRRAVVAAGATLALARSFSGFVEPARSAAAALSCGTATPGAAGSPAAVATAVPAQAQPAEQNPAGDIPDSQVFVRYVSAAGGYSIEMPEGWARTENGAGVLFADKLHEFGVEIGCATAAPTVESAAATDIPTLAQTAEAFALESVTAITLPSGPAIKISYQANSRPDDVTGKQHRLELDRYELFKDGRLALITLAAPAGSDNVDVSNQVASSFQWT